MNGKVRAGRWIEDDPSVGSDAASGRYQTADDDGNTPVQLTTLGERHVRPREAAGGSAAADRW